MEGTAGTMAPPLQPKVAAHLRSHTPSSETSLVAQNTLPGRHEPCRMPGTARCAVWQRDLELRDGSLRANWTLCPVAPDHSGGSVSGGAWRRQCLLGPWACEQRQLLGPSGWQNQQASCLGAEGRGPQIRTAMMVAGSGENDRNLQLSSSINFL